jgi:hypothetical protein
MAVFSVSTGVIKKANQLLINSNKLTSVFYNVGKKFVLTNAKDLTIAKDILSKNFIKVTVL